MMPREPLQQLDIVTLAKRMAATLRYLIKQGDERLLHFFVWSMSPPVITVLEENPKPEDAVKALEQKALELKRQLALLERLTAIRHCKECGTPFPVSLRNRTKVFCSKKCKNRHKCREWYRRHKSVAARLALPNYRG